MSLFIFWQVSGLFMQCVYVGIVTYNSLDVLPACLDSLAEQTFSNLEITILENASHDGTTEWLKAYDDQSIKLLQSPTNVGFAKAHNQIIGQYNMQSGDFYFALNPDVKLTPTYIEELISGINNVGAGWGTGKLIQAFNKSQVDYIYSVGHGIQQDGYVFNIGNGIVDNGKWEFAREIWGAPATAVIISADLIHKLQTIDCIYEETFFLYNEDTDFDWKARNIGELCFYIPRAIAYHRGGTPTQKLRVLSIGNRYLSAIKNAPLQDLFVYILPRLSIHVLLRCLFTPMSGFIIICYLCKHTPMMLKKRQLLSPSRSVFIKWVKKSQLEDTSEPRTMHDRLRVFINRLFVTRGC